MVNAFRSSGRFGRPHLFHLLVVPLPETTDEQALVQRLLARDAQALGLLEARYGGSLLAVIVRVVRNRELAEELLQEGLLKVWTNIASYEAEKGRLFTWMVRACCNQAIDAMRSPRHRFHQRNKPLEVLAVSQISAPASFNPEHIGLRELTLQLKPRQLAVIDLLYFGWLHTGGSGAGTRHSPGHGEAPGAGGTGGAGAAGTFGAVGTIAGWRLRQQVLVAE